MKPGDLVKIRNCREEGKLGVIIHAPKRIDSLYGFGFAVYYVLCEGCTKPFTGNQLTILESAQ